VVLMDDAERSSDPILLAQRLLGAFGEPFEVEGTLIDCSASIGIAVSRQELESAEQVLRAADIAARRAAERGGGIYELCDPELHDRTLDLIELFQDLRLAVRQRQLGVSFQPIVSLGDPSRVRAVEALARWHHPRRGLVEPARFIPLAEQMGTISAVGREVLERSCADLAASPRWLRGEWRHAALSVNVSGRQLSRLDLVDDLLAILRRNGVPPSRFVVEITESALVDEPKAALAIVRALREHGVRFHIDDFGTGFASMTYLQRFPCEAIKLDKSFVSTMLEDGSSFEIVRAAIALAHQLGKEVIAEGVERPEQLAALRELRCDLGQGYLFGRPAPVRSFDRDDERAVALPPATAAAQPVA